MIFEIYDLFLKHKFIWNQACLHKNSSLTEQSHIFLLLSSGSKACSWYVLVNRSALPRILRFRFRLFRVKLSVAHQMGCYASFTFFWNAISYRVSILFVYSSVSVFRNLIHFRTSSWKTHFQFCLHKERCQL